MKTITFTNDEFQLVKDLLNVHKDVAIDQIEDSREELEDIYTKPSELFNDNQYENNLIELSQSYEELRTVMNLSRKVLTESSKVNLLKSNDIVVVAYIIVDEINSTIKETIHTTHIYNNNMSYDDVVEFLSKYHADRPNSHISVLEIFR